MKTDQQPGINHNIPASRGLLMKLWLTLGGSALFFITVFIQGAVRPGYDAWHQSVSALSLGSGGWLQISGFILFGLVIVGSAPIWRSLLAGGKGHTSYPIMTALLGLCFIAIGFFPQDPAPGYDPDGLALKKPTAIGLLHLALAAIASICSIANLLIMAKRISGDPYWRGWTAYSRAMAALMIASIIVYAVWSTKASGFAGSFERLAMIIPFVWTITFLRRLSDGVPFMPERYRQWV